MLFLILALFLLTVPNDRATGSLQTTPQAATENAPAKLSPSEMSELRKKADSGDPAAQFALGKAYESGNGVPQRPDQAATWYRKAAEQGNARAQNSLGVLYWLGEGLEKDRNQAVGWYHKAARQGDAGAMFNLGAAYYNGDGVGVNDTLAYAWFLLSTEGGDPSGLDAARRSQSERPYLFNDACVAIGQMYEKGDDLPRNVELAAVWYLKAQERGSNEAVIDLAGLYLNTNNLDRAHFWCDKAARLKLAGGYYCLGYFYQRGLAGAQDSKEAFRWYEQGARRSHAPSMRALAQMYEKGEGTKSDRPQAFVWYFLAARHGNHEALLDARRLRLSMSESEWKKAQKKLPDKFDVKMVDTILGGNDSPATQ
jgi:TPR repeat protein